MSKAYERAVQLNTTLKAIITWHEEQRQLFLKQLNLMKILKRTKED